MSENLGKQTWQFSENGPPPRGVKPLESKDSAGMQNQVSSAINSKPTSPPPPPPKK